MKARSTSAAVAETRRLDSGDRREDREGSDGREKLSELFEREFDSVYRFALSRTGSHATAEDVCSDVFTEAARRFADDPSAQIEIGWLITVARRRVIDRWRSDERQRKRLERAVRLDRSSQTDVFCSGDSVPSNEIIEALKRLPARQRIAITLRYLDGYSVDEIANELSCSYSAAESLLSRGRAQLLKYLESFS